MQSTGTKISNDLLDNLNLTITSSPHIKSRNNTQSIMRDIIIALIPTSLAGIYFFGFRALAVICVGIIFAVLSEYFFQKLTGKKNTIADLSAAVTGLLLALNLPVDIPLWIVAIGSIFAVVVVKQCFGGIGCNFMNPALGARAFLLACWSQPMTKFTVDGLTTATPLGVLKIGQGNLASFSDVFLGNIGGCIGEVSALALLIGAAYLLYRRVISYHIPLAYIATVFILTTVIGRNGFMTGKGLYEIFTGGLIIGAFFMATDYSTCPMTRKGQVIFAIGCGVINTLIRIFGRYAEGTSYAIILMNLFVPMIDSFTVPKPFGYVKNKITLKK